MASSAKDPSVISELQKSHVPVPWCDEYEKMISGLNFSTYNSPEMQEYKLGTLKKLNDFNNLAIPENSTLTSLKQRRMAVAKSMLGQLGEGANIEPPFFVGWGCNVFIGDGVYINREVSLYDNALIRIGDRVLIGPGVCICTGTHKTAAKDRQEASGTSFARPITIEADCWIGARATILDGVRIGAGTTIAAGAVVTQDIEAGCLAGGVPAKVLRRL
ncbi:hypothetical protein N7510_002545 [Penicillium lagena]|uniref:uncharacterized protein n=1 Tax=Penicillium lagena TaxID=94218 RepID=UPI0025401D7E|nr:uncharacterized protein N7510_002545 [Penicillium lagena]KAJ5626236.1 hypothetical protein N7510_002545 [Penicillium lagena]